jgi:hypothetical protein
MSKFDLVNCIKNLKKLKNIGYKNLLVGIAIIGIIITGGLILAKSNIGFSLPSFFGKSDSQIGKDTINYINTNGLSSTPASLVKVSEESGLVKVTIKIGTQQFDSYVSKDGKFLFASAIDMSPAKTTAAANQNANSQTPTAVTKNEKPSLEAFVVSSCPYGLQMQRAIVDAVKNLPSLASNVVIRYIGDISNGEIESMHGPEEAAENLRQICIRQEQPSVFYNYLSCYMKKTTATAEGGMPLGDSTGCQASTGVNTSTLNACVTDSSRGLAYAQKDFDLATKYNVSGSPTLILNGAQISETGYGGRSSDGVRSMVCAGFKTEAGFCSTKLNTTEASISFNATYASTSGASTANNNCATAQ